MTISESVEIPQSEDSIQTNVVTRINGPFRQIANINTNRQNDENYYKNPLKGATYTISKYPGKVESIVNNDSKLKDLKLKLKSKQAALGLHQSQGQNGYQNVFQSKLIQQKKKYSDISTLDKPDSTWSYNRRVDESSIINMNVNKNINTNMYMSINDVSGKSNDVRSLLTTPVLMPSRPSSKSGMLCYFMLSYYPSFATHFYSITSYSVLSNPILTFRVESFHILTQLLSINMPSVVFPLFPLYNPFFSSISASSLSYRIMSILYHVY